MFGANPSGCRLRRSTLTGGVTSAGTTSARSGDTIRRDESPAPIDGERRTGFMFFKDETDGVSRRLHLGRVERPLRKHRREAVRARRAARSSPATRSHIPTRESLNVSLRGVGFVLIPFVLLVCWAAVQRASARGVVFTIVLLNALWVAASAALLIGGWVAPTALSYAFVIAQALFVGVFAWLQCKASRHDGDRVSGE